MDKKHPSHHGNDAWLKYKLYATCIPFLPHDHNQSLSRYKVVYASLAVTKTNQFFSTPDLLHDSIF